MKKCIAFFILTAGLIFYPADTATIIASSAGRTSDIASIYLYGNFRKTSNIRSGGDAITVEVQGNNIMATFHRDIGNVQVTIVNATGATVYESTVNTSVQYQAFIPLSGLPSGKYTITFSNNLGSMYGEFET